MVHARPEMTAGIWERSNLKSNLIPFPVRFFSTRSLIIKRIIAFDDGVGRARARHVLQHKIRARRKRRPTECGEKRETEPRSTAMCRSPRSLIIPSVSFENTFGTFSDAAECIYTGKFPPYKGFSKLRVGNKFYTVGSQDALSCSRCRAFECYKTFELQ